MGMTSNVMMASSAISNGINQYNAYNTKAAYEKQQASANARLALVAETETMKEGDTQAAQAMNRGNQMVGKQRAAYASQGVSVNSGSAASEQDQTKDISDADAMTAHNNAWRRAWGIAVSSNNTVGELNMEAAGDKFSGTASLISGGLQALNAGIKAGQSYYSNKKVADGSPGSVGNKGDVLPTHETLSPDGYSYTGTGFSYNSSLWGKL